MIEFHKHRGRTVLVHPFEEALPRLDGGHLGRNGVQLSDGHHSVRTGSHAKHSTCQHQEHVKRINRSASKQQRDSLSSVGRPQPDFRRKSRLRLYHASNNTPRQRAFPLPP